MAGVRSRLIPSDCRNLETFSLFWLDASVNESEENRQAQDKLREIINHLQTFTEQKQCKEYLSSFSNQDRCILIVSGQLGQQIVPQIHHLRQLSAVYVYCRDKALNDKWAVNYVKVKSVVIRLDTLIANIRSDQILRQKIEEPLDISIHTINGTQDYTTIDLNGGFIHSLLLIDVLLRMESNNEDKRQLIERCRAEYRNNGNDLMMIEEFDRTYSPKKALWCIDRDKAMEFLNNTNLSHDLYPILFIIDADPQVGTTRPFADISSQSAFHEQEVLFMIGCVFRLISISEDNQIYIVHMELCGDKEYDLQNLFQHMKDEYVGNDRQVGWGSFGAVLHKMGKYDLAEIFYRRALNETSSDNSRLSSIYQSLGMIYEDKGDYESSLKMYRKALEIQMKNDPSNYVRIGGIYCCIGVIYKKHGSSDTALEYYFEAIDLFHKANDEYHRDLASFYNNIAIIYNGKKEYTEALNYYKKTLDIESKHLPDDHVDLGMTYNNIGLVYYDQGDYDRAMSYYDQSLEIKLRALPSDHPLIAKSYVNIGRVYEARNDRKQTLLYFQKAAAIRHRVLSPAHPDVIKIDQDIQRIQSKLQH